MKKILSVAYETPCEEIEYVPFDSSVSLLDADLIIFRPNISEFLWSGQDTYMGKPSLSDSRSFSLKERADHWRREILDAFNAGKTVIVFLDEAEEVYIATGEKQYSGTGRNRTTTRIVTAFNNYACIPLSLSPINSTGTGMVLLKGSDIVKSYWADFGSLTQYRVRLEGEIKHPIIATRSGNKCVGALITSKQGGHLLLLPYFSFEEEEKYWRESDKSETGMEWTEEALVLSRKFLSAVIEIDKGLKAKDERTPAPDWALASHYVLPREAEFQEQALRVESEISRLQEEKTRIKERLQAEGVLRNLLFEKGPALEIAILEALKLLGFQANNYKDSESEFDAVFEASEGRFLGEAEGKDNVQVNIDKMRQLEMNIQEDFARDEVQSPAKGVLFGNAFRLTDPAGRKDYFTEKCLSAAKRGGIALVRTPDLFHACRYLAASGDPDFARLCREAILSAHGEIVLFPTEPSSLPAESKEEEKSSDA
jgi:hypothetical protein